MKLFLHSELIKIYSIVFSDDFSEYIPCGIVLYSDYLKKILETCDLLSMQIKENHGSNISSVLLYGQNNTGKTALATHIAKTSGIPCIKLITPNDLIGYSVIYTQNSLGIS